MQGIIIDLIIIINKPHVIQEEERKKKLLEEMKKSKEPEIPPFQQLYISCPDGLHVNYLTEAIAGMIRIN